MMGWMAGWNCDGVLWLLSLAKDSIAAAADMTNLMDFGHH